MNFWLINSINLFRFIRYTGDVLTNTVSFRRTYDESEVLFLLLSLFWSEDASTDEGEDVASEDVASDDVASDDVASEDVASDDVASDDVASEEEDLLDFVEMGS